MSMAIQKGADAAKSMAMDAAAVTNIRVKNASAGMMPMAKDAGAVMITMQTAAAVVVTTGTAMAAAAADMAIARTDF